LKADWCIAVAG